MATASLPAAVRSNDETIGASLMVAQQSDSQLAQALWECQQNGYYRIFGYRSLKAYLRERWKDTEFADMALIHSRSIQRLLKEYKVALDIPAFGRAFDQIQRAKRRLIAPLLTLDNADEWIDAALTMTVKELTKKIRGAEPDDERDPSRMYLSLYPGQRGIWEQVKMLARDLTLQEGNDPEKLTDAMILEITCAEYLAAYGPEKTLTSSCPSCDRVSRLRRVVDADLSSNGMRALGLSCGACGAALSLVARTSEPVS